LITQALHQVLLLISSSSSNSSSSSSRREALVDATTAATHNHEVSLHHRVHERYSEVAGSSTSGSSSNAGALGPAAAAAAAAGAVPVGVVSEEELQSINNVVRQVRCFMQARWLHAFFAADCMRLVSFHR
jgi:hypothetical protein